MKKELPDIVPLLLDFSLEDNKVEGEDKRLSLRDKHEIMTEIYQYSLGTGVFDEDNVDLLYDIVMQTIELVEEKRDQ